MVAIVVNVDSIKMLRETLCLAQSLINQGQSGRERKEAHIQRLQSLINDCDRYRPIGPDGKHGDRHTPTCGCDHDVAVDIEVIEGTPLSGGDFIIKLSTDQVSLIAWALEAQANNLPKDAWGKAPSQEMANEFAALSGDH